MSVYKRVDVSLVALGGKPIAIGTDWPTAVAEIAEVLERCEELLEEVRDFLDTSKSYPLNFDGLREVVALFEGAA